jgi:CRISPR-associated protein Cas5t
MTLLYLECPCTSFPRSFARDYKETYHYPPPSTLYGFLLSLVGEKDLTAHLGFKLAIGVIGCEPPISHIVRKQRHHKYAGDAELFEKHGEGVYPTQNFSKPNHQELLTSVQIAIQISSDEESSQLKLTERVKTALSAPENISRFGGLSLGESWALVNGIRAYRDSDGAIQWLTKDNRGIINLPVWINRKTGQGTFQRFSLGDFNESCWVSIIAS